MSWYLSSINLFTCVYFRTPLLSSLRMVWNILQWRHQMYLFFWLHQCCIVFFEDILLFFSEELIFFRLWLLNGARFQIFVVFYSWSIQMHGSFCTSDFFTFTIFLYKHCTCIRKYKKVPLTLKQLVDVPGYNVLLLGKGKNKYPCRFSRYLPQKISKMY